MIYLIDDKKNRQSSYGWSDEIFEKYSNIITPIYTYEELETKNLSNLIFNENNILLIHESFFDNPINKSKYDSITIRDRTNTLINERKPLLVGYFSGSKDERNYNDNIIHLPVATFYGNLELFINNLIEKRFEPKFLLFGENPDIEEKIRELSKKANENIDDLIPIASSSKNFYLRSRTDFIQNPLSSELLDEEVVSNIVKFEELSEKLNSKFANNQYNNIFIPLCFGPTLSDFNGLKLALDLRCTKSLNQLSNIYIYSFLDYSYILKNQYFDILKTKNVFLIEFKRSAFASSIVKKIESLSSNQLPNELKKLSLDIPGNFYDNHSIASEWGMYRLLELDGIDYKTIKSLDAKNNRINNVYFKWLLAKNRQTKLINKEIEEVRKEYRVIVQRPTVIGKIDLPDTKNKNKK